MKKQQCGRPETYEQAAAFFQVATYFQENGDEQIALSSLVDKMKRKLQKHFRSDIIFTEINGKSNVVTFKCTASSILQNFYERPKSKNSEEEKSQIIITAAKLICSDIK